MSQNDLISRSALLECIEQAQSQCKNLAEHVFFDGVLAIVDNAPAIDAVEVVRCKDCVNREISPINPQHMYCRGLDVSLPTNLDFYCARGVKMDAEVER